MNCSLRKSLDGASILLTIFAAMVALFSTTAFASNPSSGTTTTGQVLTVSITSPQDGTVFPGPQCETTVEGVVTLSAVARNNISVLYVVDVSGSTADPFAFSPVDVNGDGVINAGDDFNGDGFNGDILDAEIAGALALNGSIHNFDEVSVGMIAYASLAASADISPAAGFQNFVSPPRNDSQRNGVPDIEEVFRSLDSDITQGGSIDLFTPISRDSLGNSTNFEAALRAVIATFAARPNDEQKLVYFLSDGRNEIGGDIADEIAQAAGAGIVINTVGITSNSDPTLLTQIAEGTGGRFTQVDNPAELRVVLPAIPLVGIEQVLVNEQQVTLSAIGTFSTNIELKPGANVISATAIADDQTTVTASISTTCGVEPLVCELEIVEPANGILICGDHVTVRAVSRVSGGVSPIQRQCLINGVPVTSMNDTLTAEVTVGPDNRIVAICTYTDAQGNSTVCEDAIELRRPEPLACVLEITAPPEGLVVCGDSVDVSGKVEVTGGVPPFIFIFEVNGVNVDVASGGFAARVPLLAGDDFVRATCTIVDSCGATTVCEDSVEIERPAALAAQVEITSPADGEFVCDDSVTVTGTVVVTGGAPPFNIFGEVNGVLANVVGNELSARVPITAGENGLVLYATVSDSCGATFVAADTVRVMTTNPPQRAVKILSPQNGAAICADSVLVTAASVVPGISSLPPGLTCDINGVPADVSGEMFSAMIALNSDTTFIVATCVETDVCGRAVIARDSIFVVRPPAPEADVRIVSPENDDVVCGDSLTVLLELTVTAGFPPFTVACEVNGFAATLDGQFSARIPLISGENHIVAVCTVTDSCGSAIVSRDSITVFRDDVPPSCSFRNEGLNIVGVFTDEHSGIAAFEPVRLKNSKLTVEDFTPGAKSVNFLLEPIDPDKPTGFSIDIIDLCGNRFNCDPVFTRLDIDRSRQIDFTFPSEDRYLQITNFGLTEVRLDLNGNKFEFTADLARAQNANTFFLSPDGRLTVDLGNYLSGDENAIFIAFDGPPAAAADLFLLDHVHHVDFVLELKALPTEFRLSQNYPNPFNPSTQIRFDIPERMTDGVQVQLRVYNLLGELVRVAMDERKLPGAHTLEWDGRNDRGETVSSGIYIYQLVAGEFREMKRMLLLK
jgi:hypothetical protein